MRTIPVPEPLIFPRGVRFPTKEDLPSGSEDVLAKVALANIRTGFTIQSVDGKPFTSYIEAIVHAPDIFDVFRKLSLALMPEVCAPIIGLKDDEPVFGPYTERALATAVFEPHADMLQNDGFLEFGLIHESRAGFEEIFVASPKYFRIWTNDGEKACAVLYAAGLPQSDNLQFIDEFPMVSLSSDEEGNAAWVLPYNAIQESFNKLPTPLSGNH